MGEVIQTVGPLAGICGHDGTNWEKVLIDASKRLVVAVASIVASDVHEHQYDGANWVKSNLLWGYNDRWNEYGNETLTAANQIYTTTAVPTGYVYVLESASFVNNSRDMGAGPCICTYDGSQYYRLVWQLSLTATYWQILNHRVTLKAGDQVAFLCFGGAIGDSVFWRVWGYKMKVNM